MMRGESLTANVLKAMTLFGSISVVTMLCSVVRNKLVACFIGAAGIGLLGLFNTVIEMAGALAVTGVRTSGVRFIAVDDSQLRNIVVVRRYGLWLALAQMLLVAVASPLLSRVSFGSGDYTWDFMALALMVGLNTYTAIETAVLQGAGMLRRIATTSVLAAVVALVCVIPMIVRWGIDAIIPILLTYSLCNALAFAKARFKSGISMPKVPNREVFRQGRSIMVQGLYITLSSVVTAASGYVIMSWLNHRGGDELAGLYQSGFTLSIIYTGLVFTAMSMEYFPRLSKAVAIGLRRAEVMMRHQSLISVGVLTALGCLMTVFSPLIVKLLYSECFMAVVPMVVLSTPGLIARGVSWTMAYVLVADGSGRYYLLTELLSAVACVGCITGGYVLWGLTGVGIGFTVWYMLYAVVVAMVVRRLYGISPGYRVVMWSAASVVLLIGLGVVCLSLGGWL